MANANAPFGFRPVRGAFSQPYNDAANVYAAAAGDAQEILLGDPVTITGTATADGISIVARSTAGSTNAITGVAVGFRPYGATEWLGYRPASTAYEVLVEDNPLAVFELQVDGDGAGNGAALAATNVGQNAAIVFGTPPNKSRSAAMLDSSTAATTAGLQVKLLGLTQRVDNAFGNYAVWLVQLNNVTTTPNAASAGI